MHALLCVINISALNRALCMFYDFHNFIWTVLVSKDGVSTFQHLIEHCACSMIFITLFGQSQKMEYVMV
jgi:hypothetical protein